MKKENNIIVYFGMFFVVSILALLYFATTGLNIIGPAVITAVSSYLLLDALLKEKGRSEERAADLLDEKLSEIVKTQVILNRAVDKQEQTRQEQEEKQRDIEKKALKALIEAQEKSTKLIARFHREDIRKATEEEKDHMEKLAEIMVRSHEKIVRDLAAMELEKGTRTDESGSFVLESPALESAVEGISGILKEYFSQSENILQDLYAAQVKQEQKLALVAQRLEEMKNSELTKQYLEHITDKVDESLQGLIKIIESERRVMGKTRQEGASALASGPRAVGTNASAAQQKAGNANAAGSKNSQTAGRNAFAASEPREVQIPDQAQSQVKAQSQAKAQSQVNVQSQVNAEAQSREPVQPAVKAVKSIQSRSQESVSPKSESTKAVQAQVKAEQSIGQDSAQLAKENEKAKAAQTPQANEKQQGQEPVLLKPEDIKAAQPQKQPEQAPKQESAQSAGENAKVEQPAQQVKAKLQNQEPVLSKSEGIKEVLPQIKPENAKPAQPQARTASPNQEAAKTIQSQIKAEPSKQEPAKPMQSQPQAAVKPQVPPQPPKLQIPQPSSPGDKMAPDEIAALIASMGN